MIVHRHSVDSQFRYANHLLVIPTSIIPNLLGSDCGRWVFGLLGPTPYQPHSCHHKRHRNTRFSHLRTSEVTWAPQVDSDASELPAELVSAKAEKVWLIDFSRGVHHMDADRIYLRSGFVPIALVELIHHVHHRGCCSCTTLQVLYRRQEAVGNITGKPHQIRA